MAPRPKRLRMSGPAAVLAGCALCGCPGETNIQDQGWHDAIKCIEVQRSYAECRKPRRSEARYAAGWGWAIACMEQERNLAACREPRREE